MSKLGLRKLGVRNFVGATPSGQGYFTPLVQTDLATKKPLSSIAEVTPFCQGTI